MRVKDLIEWLQEFDENKKVYVAERQQFGSDWVYTIDDIEVNPCYKRYGSDERSVVMLMMGEQTGTIGDADDFDDDDEEEDE